MCVCVFVCVSQQGVRGSWHPHIQGYLGDCGLCPAAKSDEDTQKMVDIVLPDWYILENHRSLELINSTAFEVDRFKKKKKKGYTE